MDTIQGSREIDRDIRENQSKNFWIQKLADMIQS